MINKFSQFLKRSLVDNQHSDLSSVLRVLEKSEKQKKEFQKFLKACNRMEQNDALHFLLQTLKLYLKLYEHIRHPQQDFFTFVDYINNYHVSILLDHKESKECISECNAIVILINALNHGIPVSEILNIDHLQPFFAATKNKQERDYFKPLTLPSQGRKPEASLQTAMVDQIPSIQQDGISDQDADENIVHGVETVVERIENVRARENKVKREDVNDIDLSLGEKEISNGPAIVSKDNICDSPKSKALEPIISQKHESVDTNRSNYIDHKPKYELSGEKFRNQVPVLGKQHHKDNGKFGSGDSFTYDPKVLKEKEKINMASTRRLGAILDSDAVKTSVSQSQNQELDQNQESIHMILKQLLSKEEWPINKVESIFRHYNILFGDGTRQINEISQSTINESILLIEGDMIYIEPSEQQKNILLCQIK